eukprot:TRINITY_DN26490_c0_g1_i1.p2 TRINITY_DN26490_c0_g1~~TRINITY_DN26490_c0_g1_i1.p2  ORF type:complete len:314 (+),score=104.52 TRINITY_DN26490_c0_g1_i1:78-1019(+)
MALRLLARPYLFLCEALSARALLRRLYDYIACSCAALWRLYSGGVGTGRAPAAGAALPVLYEFEGCPFCKKVREAASCLSLDLDVRPCPRETLQRYGVCRESRFRPEVQQLGGKLIFPFLADSGRHMYNSDDIVKHLWETYGGGARRPLNHWLGSLVPQLQLVGLFLSAACRPLPQHGMLRTPSHRPALQLELWSREPGPGCRIAREALSTLELPYRLRNLPLFAPREKRAEYWRRFGAAAPLWARLLGVPQLPVLHDPNSGTTVRGGAAVAEYLFRTYQAGETVRESLTMYSTAGATAEHGTVAGLSRTKHE